MAQPTQSLQARHKQLSTYLVSLLANNLITNPMLHKGAELSLGNRVFNLIANVNKQLIAYFGQTQLIAIL